MSFRRLYSSLLRKPLRRLDTSSKKLSKPDQIGPARTRFAPSPTGFLHLGSLRTALYNYLLAKATGGQFLLRLEDTDQKRLVQGAEQNIYDSLRWCGINWDEGPLIGGPSGPYRQSNRSKIYAQYSKTLLESGHAYRCFCSKERLDSLRESAKKLQPPTTVTYDRNCAHISQQDSNTKASNGESFTVRFKSPNKYPVFEDLLHGKLDLQPQVNKDDVRYDDIVLVKSDGLPTYHFANVVDDHLMNITHVIRGEEWLPSTPKHIALYDAFGWKAPYFVHIPLLTSTKDKKLSKRSGDIDVTRFKADGILPEALVNFVALFGWSPKSIKDSSSEVFSLEELAKFFKLKDLTKGNAKVDDKKLYFFNKVYLADRIKNDDKIIIQEALSLLSQKHTGLSEEFVSRLLKTVAHTLTTVHDVLKYDYLITSVDFDSEIAQDFIQTTDTAKSISILESFKDIKQIDQIDQIIADLTTSESLNLKKKDIFPVLRFALSGGSPGLKIPLLIDFIGIEEAQTRIQTAIEVLRKHWMITTCK